MTAAKNSDPVEEPTTPVEPAESATAPDHETAELSPGLDSPPAAPAVVYVDAPQPPKKKGARGVGALVVLLGAAIYAGVYAVLIALLGLIAPPAGATGVLAFFGAPAFWIPVLVFALSYLLLVIVVGGAGWWAHVLGGFVVAALVYAAFIGAAIISAGAFGAAAPIVGAVVLQALGNPIGFAAAIAAREVPIWVGGLVAKRGRAARARNVEARAAYERELAEHRATVAPRTAV